MYFGQGQDFKLTTELSEKVQYSRNQATKNSLVCRSLRSAAEVKKPSGHSPFRDSCIFQLNVNHFLQVTGDWLTEWLDGLNGSYWLIEWLYEWLIASVIDCLKDRLVKRVIEGGSVAEWLERRIWNP